MRILDINVLVYAHNTGAPEHAAYYEWLVSTVNGDEQFVVPEIVAAGFVRITTHPRILPNPLPVRQVFEALAALRSEPTYFGADIGATHRQTFERLCIAIDARGDDIPDAYLAAIAIEHDATLYTVDRGFRRFPGLRWRHPLDG
ncbi:MAG: type II toxin-antitoxin system VapC family toxin [Dehalococcoidia bacterium]